MGHNARVLDIHDSSEIAAEMRRVGAEPGGIARMLPKARHYLVKLEQVRVPLGHILKESFLSAGGEAVVSRDVITSKATHTDVILIGSHKHFRAVADALRAQKFGAIKLAAEIWAAIDAFDSHPLALPDDVRASSRVRVMFDEMSRRALVMGILNVTPDSFSDGGQFLNHAVAAERAMRMAEEGADIIDIGGESTRPGSDPVPADEELSRIVPVIKNIRGQSDVLISVDTYKAAVARSAIEAGADIVNDVSAMSFDADMRATVAELGVPAILMHTKGAPKSMQTDPEYKDVLAEVTGELRKRLEECVEAGIDRRLMMIDPGFGFGKTSDHNLTILRRLREFKSLGRPILMGTSRKSTIGAVLGGLPADERMEGTAATVAISVMNGANMVRVHDVKEMARVVRMTNATMSAGRSQDETED
jgi:dihydropteroate synthase